LSVVARACCVTAVLTRMPGCYGGNLAFVREVSCLKPFAA
jgi:hypothetical protein